MLGVIGIAVLLAACSHPAVSAEDAPLQKGSPSPTPTGGGSKIPQSSVSWYEWAIKPRNITLPLNPANIMSILFLLIAALFGVFQAWKIGSRRSCACDWCRGMFFLEEEENQVLHGGGFGTVKIVRKYGDSKKDMRYVMKMVKVDSVNDANDAQREARELQNLQHPYIVNYVADFLHSTRTELQVCIVMDYYEAGDLKRLIYEYQDRDETIPERQVMVWFFQICQALKFVHSRRIIHRDIKTHNCFLDLDDSVHVGDFGLARVMEQATQRYTSAGTKTYMAPEMLSGDVYGTQVDVWALGCLLYELVSCRIISDDISGLLGVRIMTEEGVVDGMLEEISTKYNPAIKHLIRRMLQVDPKKRPDVATILKNERVKQMRKTYFVPMLKQRMKRSPQKGKSKHHDSSRKHCDGDRSKSSVDDVGESSQATSQTSRSSQDRQKSNVATAKSMGTPKGIRESKRHRRRPGMKSPATTPRDSEKS